MEGKKMIISIGRECGSGGHEIGEKLAEHYGLKLYDRNLLTVMAAKTNMTPDEIAELDEKISGFRFFRAKKGGFNEDRDALMTRLSKSNQFYLMEKDLIEELAEKESFVIMGRAANTILKDRDDVFNIFVFAPKSFRIPRVKEFYHLDTDKDAEKKIEHIDGIRKEYFEYYSNVSWGSAEYQDVLINTALFGVDETVKILISLIDKKFGITE